MRRNREFCSRSCRAFSRSKRTAPFLIVLGLSLLPLFGGPSVRIKDIAGFLGVRDNQLIGYGLVVGLDGSGDSRQTYFTNQALSNLLNQEGIVVSPRSFQISNTAAVMVTASLPPFSRQGSKIDVTVSSIGDAESLQGGVLLMTPLRAANGQVFAVAQGPLSVAGFSAKAGGSSVQKNIPTVGRLPSGATVEREVGFSLEGRTDLTLVLHEDDFTTAKRVAQSLNERFHSEMARPLDSRTISLAIPENYAHDIVGLISQIESAEVETDTIAKVILNERTGTVVFGGNVRISAVSVVHGSLVVQVSTDYIVSQPESFANGETVVQPVPTVSVDEGVGKPVNLPEGATISEVVQALNAIGATPRDIVAVLQAIKSAGALHAELEII